MKKRKAKRKEGERRRKEEKGEEKMAKCWTDLMRSLNLGNLGSQDRERVVRRTELASSISHSETDGEMLSTCSSAPWEVNDPPFLMLL